jgi:hypothetical protein
LSRPPTFLRYSTIAVTITYEEKRRELKGASLKTPLDIPYYLELQRRMQDIFRYVSCHERNFDTYSIILESLLIDSCSFFDSLCQTFIRGKVQSGNIFAKENEVTDFYDRVSGDEGFNFGHYRKLLEGDFLLSSKEVTLNVYEDAFLSPMHSLPNRIDGYRIAPFKEWAVIPEIESPWWGAFTSLKHDRIRNFRQATLKNVIYSLSAVFIVLTLNREPEFKSGIVPLEVYDLFFPQYWAFKGRIAVMNFMWS